MIDGKLFDFENIFRVVKSTEKMKRNQLRPLRTEIMELAIEKYSGNQLRYVGDTEDGKDFIGLQDSLRYESKSMDGMFQKRAGYTKKIIIKNFQGKNLGTPEKTFDYMLLWDTKTNTVGLCDWSSIAKNFVVKDATVESYVNHEDITFLAKGVEVTEENVTNFEKKLMTEIRKLL